MGPILQSSAETNYIYDWLLFLSTFLGLGGFIREENEVQILCNYRSYKKKAFSFGFNELVHVKRFELACSKFSLSTDAIIIIMNGYVI